MDGWKRAVILWAIVMGLVPGRVSAQEIDYARAERFLPWHASRLVAGDVVEPVWMETGDRDRFWYRNKTGSGYEFVVVDPGRGARQPAFDHYRLAAAMSVADDTSYVPERLPFERFEFAEDERGIVFNAARKRFECDIRAYTCVVGDTLPSDVPFVESPDGAWEAFIHEYNVYVRPSGGGDSTRLTSDGERFFGYGLGEPPPNQVRQGDRPRRPELAWAPDSRSIAVSRTDERDVEHMHYISYTPQRPRHFSQPYALPGDSIIPLPGIHVLRLDQVTVAGEDGVDGGPTTREPEAAPAGLVASNRRVDVAPRPSQLSLRGSSPDSAWSADGSRLYVTYFTRGAKSVYLAEIEAASGVSRVILADSSPTFVELGQVGGGSSGGTPSWYVTDDGEDVIWWSEQDGWAHLYRFDGRGVPSNRITSGPWTVGTVVHVDQDARQIYFTGRGREPGRNIYYAHLYRVGFDGAGLQILTPEEGDHTVRFSPSGRYFVDTYSRIDTPPVTVLRSSDGRVIRELERADISRLEEIGFRPAEVFSVKARDGLTDLYGVIYFPPNLDPGAAYPIISHIYPGPQVGSVGGWRFKGGGEDFALAQLGFVVIQLDHMGTPFRSKAFHDTYYGNFIDNGLADHVTAIKQLGARYPFIDLDRVGIYGHSGGGFASTDAILRYPDFFKVAVSGAGNHDNRSYNIYWAEKYQGEMERDSSRGGDNFEDAANKAYAENLRGHLLLMHGDMDDNVHPAMTIQLVDELIKANKDFDLIIAPDRGHGLNEPYFIRRRWDYFVRHLLGVEPPKEYQITRPEN